MWFNQVTAYMVPEGYALTNELEDWEEAITNSKFKHCAGLDWSSRGFVPQPFNGDNHVWNVADTWNLLHRKEERVLPAKVVEEKLRERIAKINNEESRAVGRKERMELKEVIVDDLLPRALLQSSYLELSFDTQSGFIFTNIANDTRSTQLLSDTRIALQGLPATLIRTNTSPSALMTSWLLNNEAAGNFELDSDCVMCGVGNDAAKVKITSQDLTSQMVTAHAESGKVVTELGLVWNDQVTFVLTENLTLKKVNFGSVLRDDAANQGDDMESLACAIRTITTQTLSLIFAELIEHLGGIYKHEPESESNDNE